jgi:hypothetical protein
MPGRGELLSTLGYVDSVHVACGANADLRTAALHLLTLVKTWRHSFNTDMTPRHPYYPVSLAKFPAIIGLPRRGSAKDFC